ncbi:MAG: sulfatase [Planctomycetota bacterium]|nr:sulfatase [Planctomycetota bacterium]
MSASGKVLPQGPARRVILVTCDTLRADHLSCYGYDRPTSPRIDAFAAESLLFTSAWSAAPLTMPALSSLLSGRLPDEVGATPGNQDLMPSTARTLAEVVRDAGFDTAAFVANSVLCRVSAEEGDVGIQQGFAHFDDNMTGKSTEHAAHERSSADTTTATLKWIEARRDSEDRFFLWVHYMDPHGPYTPSPADLALFARDHSSEQDMPVTSDFGAAGAIPNYQLVGNERKPGQYVDRYDAEIHGVDAEFGRLMDGLRDKGWLDDSLVIFTSDHGESLGEGNRWFSHGDSLQRELVHVPMIVRPPQALRETVLPDGGGRRSGKLVAHLDVWPTVLESLDVDGPLNQGLSMLHASLPQGRIATSYFGRVDTARRVISICDGRWRLVTIGPNFPLLYDLASDPRETKNVVLQYPLIMERLQTSFTEMGKNAPPQQLEGQKRRMDERTRGHLGALGYTGGEPR